jgi:ubiquinone/menaquinone biosynthesis C-methylase UbiE
MYQEGNFTEKKYNRFFLRDSPRTFAYEGDIPRNYENYLGPVLFEPYAADLAGRVDAAKAKSVLELACGTGILSRTLRRKLGTQTRLIATDISEAMISYSRSRPNANDIEWKVMDAAKPDFPPASFDYVVSQFGVMLLPDKFAAFQQIRMLLVPGGKFIFNVWDSIEHNDLCNVASQVIKEQIPECTPDFLERPFAFHNREVIRVFLAAAGFDDVEISILMLECNAVSAASVALGLMNGTPIGEALKERDNVDTAAIVDEITFRLSDRFGAAPCTATMRAIVCEASFSA